MNEIGQPVRVTNRGQDMVDIVPVSDAAKSRSKSKIIVEINSLRGEITKSSARQIRAELAAVARSHRLTACDAAYIDPAVRNGLPLFTGDKNLTIAARKLGVAMVKRG